MKNTFTFCCLFLAMIGWNSIQAQYCLPTFNSACTSGDYINTFSLNLINNSSTGCGNPGTSNYTDYTSLVDNLTPGNTYTAFCAPGPSWGQYFVMWIDFNQDNDFDEANEFFDIGYASAGGSVSNSITIPSGIPGGITRMRVLCRFSTGALSAGDFCTTGLSWGECEDYSVNIAACIPTVAPTFVCPADITVNNNPGDCSTVVNFPAITASDDCGPVDVIQASGKPSGDTYDVGVTTNTYVTGIFAEDFSDNSAGWVLGPEWQIGPANPTPASCVGANPDPVADHSPGGNNGIAGAVIGGCRSNALHSFYYLTSPVIDASVVTGDLFLEFWRWLNSDYTPYEQNIIEVFDGISWITIWITGGAPSIQDNSWMLQNFDITAYKNPNLQFRFGHLIGNSGVFTRSGWNIDDVLLYSNSASCSFNVTVIDNEDPVLVCTNFTAEIDASQTASVDVADIVTSQSDNCAISSAGVTLSGTTSYDCADIGLSFTLTASASDDNGNNGSCNASVLVTDPNDFCCELPVADCEDLTVLLDETGTATITALDILGNSDLGTCLVSPVLQISQDEFSCLDVGTPVLVSGQISEGSISSSCIATVIVLDVEPPEIECPDDINVMTDVGLSTSNVTYTAPECSDSAPSGGYSLESIVLDPGPTAGTAIGAADDFVTLGFPVGFNFNFYGTDYNTFGISTNGFITFNSSFASGCCAGQNIPNSVAPNNLIALGWTDLVVQTGTVTYATSGSAPNRVLTVSFTGVRAFASTGPDITSQVKIFETSNSIEIHLSFKNTTNSATLGIENADGTEALTPPGRNGTSWTSSGEAWRFSPTTSIGSTCDNCPGATVALTSGLGSGADFPVGTTTETYTATDASGNTSSCSFNINVSSNDPPSITCPSDQVYPNITEQCYSDGHFDPPVGEDSDEGAVTTLLSGIPHTGYFPVGVTTNTYLVTDIDGNTATCSFTITVEDTEEPVISCSADIIVSNDPGFCGAVINYAQSTSSDNCTGTDATTLTSGLPPGSLFPIGTTDIVFTATDAGGNSAVCEFSITVKDTEGPEVTCPGSVDVSANNDCQASIPAIAPGVTDNCAGAVVTQVAGAAPGSLQPIGTYTQYFKITDANGNVDFCEFDINVVDNVDPDIECPASTTISTDPGACSAQYIYAFPEVSDNCYVNTLIRTAGLPPYATFPIGATVTTYEVADLAGNTNECSFTVIVTDNEEPVLDCQDIEVSANDPGGESATLTITAPVATDNCAVVGLPVNNSNLSSSITITVFGAFPRVLTWSVDDSYGNTGSCDQTITVNTCLAPEGLVSTIAPPNSATVSWDPVPGALGYQVRGRIAGTLPFASVLTSGTSRTLNNLIAGQTYEWQVRVKCGDGTISEYSFFETFTMPSLKGQEMKSGLDIYPNPVSDRLNALLHLAHDDVMNVQLVNVIGEILETRDLNLVTGIHNIDFDVSSFSSGIYFIRITGSKTDLVKRFVVGQ